MPILVRPVREQIEHDRVIRQLQEKWRRKYRADINPGDERTAVVQAGSVTLYPDLVLTSEGQKKPSAVVEVETGESVNHLEAMSQWATFARSRIPFYLFVPAGSLDSARRLVADHQIELAELWTYFVIGEQIRFTPVIRAASSAADAVADKLPLSDKRVENRADRRVDRVDKAEAEKPVERAAEKVAERAAAKSAEVDKVDKIAHRAAEPEKEKEAITREEPRARQRAERTPRAGRAAAPAPKAPKARRAAVGRASAPPPRRKAATGKRAVTPKRGVRGSTKRAVAAKRPARGAAKRAAAAVRRPAKTNRPAAKRARAQKRR